MIVSKKSFWAAQVPMLSVGGMAAALMFIDLLMPFTSAYADVAPAYLLYLGFFTILYVFYTFLVVALEATIPHYSNAVRVPNKVMNSSMSIACFLSVLGVCSLVVDRTIYQGVDFFTQNFVEIRSRLNAERPPGSGVSSIFSVFGNLFQFTYFFTLICLVFYSELIGRRKRIMYWFVVLGLLFSGSYMLGGRSIIGLFALTLVGAIVARVVSGRSQLGRLLKFRFLVVMFVFGWLVLFAIAFVFYARASVSDLSSSDYLLNFVEHLRGRAVVGYARCGGGVECDFLNYLQLSGIYVSHIFWVFAELVENPIINPQGFPVYGATAVILEKMTGRFSGDYEFAGLFNSLPGSLYYQYGALGMIVGGIFLGCSLAFAVVSLRSRGGILSLVSFYALFMILLVAPVLSILNMMVFIFMFFSLVVMSLAYLVGVAINRRLAK